MQACARTHVRQQAPTHSKALPPVTSDFYFFQTFHDIDEASNGKWISLYKLNFDYEIESLYEECQVCAQHKSFAVIVHLPRT